MAGKVIAVTGASRGIGAAIALELARARLHRRLPHAARAPASRALRCRAPLAKRLLNVACDVNDEASIGKAFAALAAQAGTISGLVNNAGMHLDGKSAELATARYERGDGHQRARRCSCAAARRIRISRARGGTIVNIGSFFDKLGVKRNLAYCASKAAVGAITRCLAVEWAPKSIRVLDVAPGYIETELNAEAMQTGRCARFWRARIPTGGPGSAADVARLVAALFAEDIRLPHRRDDLPRRRTRAWRTDERLRAPGRHARAGGRGAHARGERAHARARADRAARRALRPQRRVPLGQREGHQRARPERHVHPRGLRRRAALLRRLSRLRARDQQGLRLHRHHLGDQLPRHQAADRFRHRGAEEAPAAADRAGRPRLARHHRAVRGLGRHRHEDALSPRGRRTSSWTAARPSSPTATSPI